MLLRPFIAAAVALATLPAAAHALPDPVKSAPAKPAGKKSAAGSVCKIKIEGMHCEGCAMGVTNKLKAVPGVKEARVDHKSALGKVTYDPAKTRPADLLNAVQKAGYKASLAK